jgi:UDP-N-acetylglucosamine 2-epimerase (hydrolysing)
MGEKKKTIFVIGSPDLDIMKKKNLPNISHAKKYYNINYAKYCILILHPVTTNKLENYRNQMIIKQLVLKNKNYNFICINPNNDPGSKEILKLYSGLKKNKNFVSFPSMRFEYFLSFVKHSICIIGNSSTGVREAPFYAINSINIGSRQNNRVKSSKFIYNVNSYNYTLNILKKIEKLKRKEFSEKKFGKGKSDILMEKLLTKKSFWNIDIQKTFIDLNRL